MSAIITWLIDRFRERVIPKDVEDFNRKVAIAEWVWMLLYGLPAPFTKVSAYATQSHDQVSTESLSGVFVRLLYEQFSETPMPSYVLIFTESW
jgi:hypothetical protein